MVTYPPVVSHGVIDYFRSIDRRDGLGLRGEDANERNDIEGDDELDEHGLHGNPFSIWGRVRSLLTF